MISTGKLQPEDRADWQVLFAGYNEFYGRSLPSELFDRAWTAFQEDTLMHALGAKLDGKLVGITHFLTHVSTTQESNATARRLYDQVAENHGFIRYRIEL
jgi:hypothetical protein